jgi:hypothetical protein
VVLPVPLGPSRETNNERFILHITIEIRFSSPDRLLEPLGAATQIEWRVLMNKQDNAFSSTRPPG